MATGNLAACLAVTLRHEGAYTNDKRDPGNWTGGKVGVGTLKGTKYGIAAASYPNLDIKNLTLNDAKPIYEAKYWRPIRGDALPVGIDLSTLDYGVNSGPSRSVKDLQSVLGLKPDGIVGADTLKAAIVADGKAVIQRHCAKRLSFMRGLKIWNTFKRGWSTRVADVEAKAVAMYLARSKPLTGADRQELQTESAKANTTATVQQTGATAAGGGGIATSGNVPAVDINWYVVAGVAVALLIVIGILLFKASHNKRRAAAYAKEAAA
ncbi:hypothetical protein HB779_17225 [Phyllobacterium sp. 628]|uniref:glycoside hydrolase family 108 protein n=1 Tax=Phyllobacterium sp. 628 TaxID=2718938 RepID=UPI0016628BC3|nr:glycosyl hydrolase 108 family protein [Phyllobacterium sp. 628]QND53433.1 hypothetical protein HB779_17225 [Phyllobacterium sp. 628]